VSRPAVSTRTTFPRARARAQRRRPSLDHRFARLGVSTDRPLADLDRLLDRGGALEIGGTSNG
jgi:hypothetical protein